MGLSAVLAVLLHRVVEVDILLCLGWLLLRKGRDTAWLILRRVGECHELSRHGYRNGAKELDNDGGSSSSSLGAAIERDIDYSQDRQKDKTDDDDDGQEKATTINNLVRERAGPKSFDLFMRCVP